MQNIIIIGGGIAGTTAAEEIRARDKECQITIIAAEQHPCYSRVLLPHYVKGKVAREKVFLKTFQWYFDHNIELMSGVRVTKIDLRNRFVLTTEGRELPYDQLLVTTGTEITLFPQDLRGVSYLSTVEDADHVITLLNELKTLPEGNRHAAVYGSGFIACEYANIFEHHGIPFSFIMRGTGLWSKIISPETQKVLLEHVQSKNVPVYLQEPSPELLGDEELTGIKLKDGTVLPANMLGVGIGVRANEHAVLEAGIPCADGILANEYLETAEKDVYTAGDAAEFTDSQVGRRLRYGNWMNALMQGRAVGKAMAGERAPFNLVSSYATNILGLQVVFIGDVSREHAEKIEQTVASPGIAEEIFIRGGKCVGAVLVGDVKRRALLTKMVGQTYGT